MYLVLMPKELGSLINSKRGTNMVAAAERVHSLPVLSAEPLEKQSTLEVVDAEYVERLDQIGSCLYGIVCIVEADDLSIPKESPYENNKRLARIAEIATKHGLLEQAA